jgi:hypothetical protein
MTNEQYIEQKLTEWQGKTISDNEHFQEELKATIVSAINQGERRERVKLSKYPICDTCNNFIPYAHYVCCKIIECEEKKVKKALLQGKQRFAERLRERMDGEKYPANELPYDDFTYEHGYNNALEKISTLITSELEKK